MLYFQTSFLNKLKKNIIYKDMYYETNQVDNILICQQCRGQLEGPKILPCGETICSFCVSSIQINLNIFECLVCKQKHEMSKNGLPDNRIALKMLSVKPRKTH